MNIQEIPKRYLKNREILEGQTVFCYWKEPSLIDDFKLDVEKDLLYDDTKNLYKIAEQLYNNQIVEFDLVSVSSFLESHEELKKIIDEMGGAKEIISQAKTVNTKNIESYYDNLQKSNYLINLYFAQKRLANEIDKMENMDSSSDVSDYVEYLIGEIGNSCRVNNKIQVDELYLSDKMFEEIISGELIETISFGDGARLLNDILYGCPLGTTTCISAPSGNGKSTFITSVMLYPMIKNGEIVTLITNELQFRQYMIMLCCIVAVKEFNYYGITRDKILKGKLDEENIETLKKVQSFINSELKNRIKFIKYTDGNIDTIVRLMKKYSKLGSRVVVFDTMKAQNSADNKAWATIIEDSKMLDVACQKTNQTLILSYQVAQYASNKRELTGAELSQGKQIKEILTNHVIFRYLHPTEYTGEKYDCKPYRWKFNESLQKSYKEEIKLDKDKRYIVAYVDKCRSGRDHQYLIYQFDGHLATYRELGFCTVVPDERR